MKFYLVGGAIRDKLLNQPVTDRDWVVVGGTPAQLEQLGYRIIGKDFPVFLHPTTHEEYALARTEKKTGKGHQGFIFLTSPKVTLAQDLQRRDLTINAIAQDQEGNYIDPYGGIHDIQTRTLRHVSSAFTEDPLRVLRTARFAARYAHLGFNIAPETIELMHHIAEQGLLNELSTERIWLETAKALSQRDCHIYFQILYDCGALKSIMPELNQLFIQQEPSLQLSLGALTLIRLHFACHLTQTVEIRFAVLCHLLDSPQKINNQTSSIVTGHNIPEHTQQFCNRLKVPNRFRTLALLTTQYQHHIQIITSLSPEQLLNFFDSIDVWRKPQRLQQLILASQACSHSKKKLHKKDDNYQQGDYLIQAYNTLKAINPVHLHTDNPGESIKKQLKQERLNALIKWKNN